MPVRVGVVALILARKTPASTAQRILDTYGLKLKNDVQAPLGSFTVIVPEGTELLWAERLRKDPEVLEAGLYCSEDPA